MIRIKYYSLLCSLLFFTSNISAEYYLVDAFPNLPSFTLTTELIHSGDGTNRFFLLQQRGLAYVFNNSSEVNSRKVFVDLTNKVSQVGGEKGLIGIAFHPNFEINRYVYFHFTFDSAGSPSNTWSRISRFTVSATNADSVLRSTEFIILTQSQPYVTHKGGRMQFGADGYLYFSLGDGGNSGDPLGHGQYMGSILGKILRINIDSAAGGLNYTIPPTNPYYSNTQGFRKEIYAHGFRNVWKFSFDFPTGRLWAGDVGQYAYEEVDLVLPGKNYGWNKMEGFHCYGTCDTTGRNFTRPVLEYSHDSGAAVTGGYVYRGANLTNLIGKYIFADYHVGKIWMMEYDGVNPGTYTRLLDTNLFLSSFGVDESNELYVCGYLDGRIYKLENTDAANLCVKAAIEGFYRSDAKQLRKDDTLNLILHSNVAPYAKIDSATAILDSLTLTGKFKFEIAPSGRYYLCVKHRNGLETWSKSGGTILTRGTTLFYDFTLDSSQAYGGNLKFKGDLYCIYSGDTYRDGAVDVYDILDIYNEAYAMMGGDAQTDLTGDNYTDMSDIAIAFNNANSFVYIIRP